MIAMYVTDKATVMIVVTVCIWVVVSNDLICAQIFGLLVKCGYMVWGSGYEYWVIQLGAARFEPSTFRSSTWGIRPQDHNVLLSNFYLCDGLGNTYIL